jgi:hypothetical protein
MTGRVEVRPGQDDSGRLDQHGHAALHLLRLTAAICIFAGHWAEPYVTDAFPQGQLAIDGFFLAEGFLAARLLAAEQRPGRTGALLVDRFGHIYPIYLAALLAGAAAVGRLALTHAAGWAPGIWLRFLLAGAALLPVDTAMVHGSVYPLNPPSWAIILELVGFAALALARRRSPRFGALLLWSAGTIMLLACAARWHDPNMGWRGERYWGGVPRMAFGFFGGALLSTLHDRVPRTIRGGWVGPILICTVFVAIQFLRVWLVAWPLLIVVTPVLVLTAAALVLPPSLQRLAAWAGRHALPVYLLGFPVMMGWRLAAPGVGLAPAFTGSPIGFAMVLATLLLAAIAWSAASRQAGRASRRRFSVRTTLSTH